MSNYTVYMHEHRKNKKKYIGITSLEPNDRWKNGKGYKKSIRFYNAIKKYGWDMFNHYILFTNLTKEEAEQKEIELIAKYKSANRKYGYNIELGGNVLGTHSEETKIKISNSHKGYIFSEEHKKHLSENQWLKGKHLKPETKEKLSLVRKGRTNEWLHKPVVCLETNIIYKNTREAEKITGIDHSCIIKCCKKKQQTAGKFHWNYAMKGGDE